jgi:hypothetical protein
VNRLPVPGTTHTLELDQLKALNEALATGAPITAAILGIADAIVPSRPGVTLPGSAVLVHLGCEGPPEFPYIWGYFRPSGPGASAIKQVSSEARNPGSAEARNPSPAGARDPRPDVPGPAVAGPAPFAVELHTQTLRELSHRLGLRQTWGA